MKKVLPILLVTSLLVTSGKVSTILADEGGIPSHEANPKVTICHRTASHSNPYTSNDVDQDSVDGDALNDNGQGDHYLNHTGPVWFEGIEVDWGDIIPPVEGAHDGLNWNAEGQTIWNNNCRLGTNDDNPEDPEDPENPEDPEDPEDPQDPGDVDPTPNPESGKHSSLGIDLSCENSFDVVMDLAEDGNPRENVKVKFKYNGEEKTAETNKDGRARVSYNVAGDQKVTAEPEDGYPSQSSNAVFPTDCEREESENNQSGEVLGTSTEETPKQQNRGQVLGISTMADTGSATEFAFLAGLSAFSLLSFLYLGYKK